MYWFVEAIMDWRTKVIERWEYLTEAQMKEIYQTYYDNGVPLVRSGRM